MSTHVVPLPLLLLLVSCSSWDEQPAPSAVLAYEQPIQAVDIITDKDGVAELLYRNEVNHETIDRVLEIPGVKVVEPDGGVGLLSTTSWGTNSTGAWSVGFHKTYELRLTKAKAYTWSEIEGALVIQGLLKSRKVRELYRTEAQ